MHPEKKNTVTTYYPRSKDIADQAKTRAHGHCDLCGCEAPFKDNKGNPFLEAHYIIWLMRGGSDSVDNVAALCPNFHRSMHVVDDPEDVKRLQAKVCSHNGH